MLFDEVHEKTFTRRGLFIGGVQIAVLCILGWRLAWLQIAQGKRYKMLSDKNRINIKILPPLRGEVVDRFGVPLAVNNRNYRVVIVPEQVKDIEESLRLLQKHIVVDKRDIERVLKAAKRSVKFIPLMVRDDLTWEDVAKIEVNLPELPGLSIDTGDVRYYPYRDATAHIVGYVRAVSPEDIKKNDEAVFKVPGFQVGKTGVERERDKRLRGKEGATEVEVNVVGREVRTLNRKEPKYGDRIALSIDAELQRFTLETLRAHKSASAVIMDAYTGAIYAMASHPSFDPNMFVRGLSQEAWQTLMDDQGRPQTNKTIASPYPPGSTFKMITALAGLKAGVINKSTRVYCPGHYEYGADRFHCWKKVGHGKMDLTMALAQSCDVYFYKMATEVGIDAIAAMGREFGLGDQLYDDLPESVKGLMPDIAWKRNVLKKPWYPGETIISSIGQGSVETTPLQLAVMTARLVNGGFAVSPHLYMDDIMPSINIEQTLHKIDVSQEHLNLVRKGMDMAVNHKKGTAFASRAEDDYQFGGKTGTAQVQRITREQRRLGVKNEDLPWKSRHHALFVGYAPLTKPRYVCSVVVEHGVGGSSAAAPLAKTLMMKVQQRDPAHSKG